jgi:hypothetical protein
MRRNASILIFNATYRKHMSSGEKNYSLEKYPPTFIFAIINVGLVGQNCFALQLFFRERSLIMVCMPAVQNWPKCGKPKMINYCAHLFIRGAKLKNSYKLLFYCLQSSACQKLTMLDQPIIIKLWKFKI